MGNGLKTEVYDTTALRKSNGVRTKDLLELYLPRFNTLKLPQHATTNSLFLWFAFIDPFVVTTPPQTALLV